MVEKNGVAKEFVKEFDTQWYSHYGMVISFLNFKEVLEYQMALSILVTVFL